MLTLDGLLAVHAARAAYTAMAAVPGVRTVDVVRGTAEVEHDGPLDLEVAREALAAVGVTIVAARPLDRRLPLHPADDP